LSLSAALLTVSVVFLLVLLIMLASSIVKVPLGHVGIYEKLGHPVGTLPPGVHLVAPFISKVYFIDTTEKTIEDLQCECILTDNTPVRVAVKIRYRVSDPMKAKYEVEDPHLALNKFAGVITRAIVGGMETEEAVMKVHKLNRKIMEVLKEECTKWGIDVEEVRIREIEIIGQVAERLAKDHEYRRRLPRGTRVVVVRGGGEN